MKGRSNSRRPINICHGAAEPCVYTESLWITAAVNLQRDWIRQTNCFVTCDFCCCFIVSGSKSNHTVYLREITEKVRVCVENTLEVKVLIQLLFCIF